MSGTSQASGEGGGAIPVEEYCRLIEAYLTRKNDGHLIRIVGPSFERVREWASRGIPLKVAYAGIDRHFERYYRKGPRRRPVLIDFCEPDILDVFDEWRRAVGVAADAGGTRTARQDRALANRIERAIARLTLLRTSEQAGRVTVSAEALGQAIRELDALLPASRRARGAARGALIGELAKVDSRLLEAARRAAGPAVLQQMAEEAGRELAPFRERMPADHWPRALEAAAERLLRERTGLPVIEPE